MAGKFELKKNSASKYYFNLKASNGEKVLTSESYEQKSGATNGISAVKDCSQYDSRYEKRNSVNGQYYFVLKSWNNEIIGTSETYTTTQSRDNGIASVKQNAPNATTVDLT